MVKNERRKKKRRKEKDVQGQQKKERPEDVLQRSVRKALEKQGISASGGFIGFKLLRRIRFRQVTSMMALMQTWAMRCACSKKDVQTCLKALELLVRDIFPSRERRVLVKALPHFCYSFRRLMLDNHRRVRELANRALEVWLSKCSAGSPRY